MLQTTDWLRAARLFPTIPRRMTSSWRFATSGSVMAAQTSSWHAPTGDVATGRVPGGGHRRVRQPGRHAPAGSKPSTAPPKDQLALEGHRGTHPGRGRHPHRPVPASAGRLHPEQLPHHPVGGDNRVTTVDLVPSAEPKVRVRHPAARGPCAQAFQYSRRTPAIAACLPCDASRTRLAHAAGRSDRAKDAEILLLRHQVAVLQRQANPKAVLG